MSTFQTIVSMIRPGESVRFKNMTLIALRGHACEADYLTLDEALEANKAHVMEVSDGGSVCELNFVNEHDQPVLLVDGEELIGAKQNRILNISIFAPAKKSLTIPVSCVEAGRWVRHSSAFRSSPQAQYARGRAMKLEHVTNSLDLKGHRYSDQSAVWNDIASKMARLRTLSSTRAMNAMFEAHAQSIEDYVAAFKPASDQIGMIVAIDENVIGLDIFDSPCTFAKLLPKLLRSYALDAIDDVKSVSSIGPGAFLRLICTAEERVFKAIGEGKDIRLRSHGFAGAALWARDRIVHFAAFNVPLQ